jgi:hypothetical protein
VLQTLKLLLPALIPSWRFFHTIAPSPRIEFTLLHTAHEASGGWQEFRPRPARLSVGAMLMRLFWNPRWNESLYLVSCAERLMTHPTEHSVREIRDRIEAELARNAIDAGAAPYLQFRLVFVSWEGAQIQRHITYISPIHKRSGTADS